MRTLRQIANAYANTYDHAVWDADFPPFIRWAFRARLAFWTWLAFALEGRAIDVWCERRLERRRSLADVAA